MLEMNDNTVNCKFYLTDNFEKINCSYGYSDLSFIELFGIKKNSTNPSGTFFLTILNNFDKVIELLENSKEFVKKPYYKLETFLRDNFNTIDFNLSNIITKEIYMYYSNEVKNILDTQDNLKHIREELNKHIAVLDDMNLYNQYYDSLIKDSKNRITILDSEDDIKHEKEFLNDLYNEKNNYNQGKKSILSLIDDMKKEEKQYIKEERTLKELPKLLEEYLSKLIHTIISYKHYFDLYYGIIEKSDFKNKNITYFQSAFLLDFEIPRYFIYSIYEEHQTFYPIKNLMLSIYDNLKNKKIKITDRQLYEKVLDTTTDLNNNKQLMYLKAYDIISLKDIFNVYFNYFIERNIFLKKCREL